MSTEEPKKTQMPDVQRKRVRDYLDECAEIETRIANVKDELIEMFKNLKKCDESQAKDKEARTKMLQKKIACTEMAIKHDEKRLKMLKKFKDEMANA